MEVYNCVLFYGLFLFHHVYLLFVDDRINGKYYYSHCIFKVDHFTKRKYLDALCFATEHKQSDLTSSGTDMTGNHSYLSGSQRKDERYWLIKAFYCSYQ